MLRNPIQSQFYLYINIVNVIYVNNPILKIILQKDTPTHNHSVGVSFLFKEEKLWGKRYLLQKNQKWPMKL
jgi:hypothetical protein